MNRNWIFILTVLAVFGLTGLTVVQIIWLKNAIAVKEQRFDNDVREALYEIAEKVESFEYEPFVKELIASNAIDIGVGSSDFKNMTYQQNLGEQKVYVYLEDGVDSSLAIEINFNKTDNWRDKSFDVTADDQPIGMEVGRLPISIMVDPHELATKYLSQKKAIHEMVLKQIFSLQPITEVLDTGNLKNIINETLAKKSIHTEFEFGVTEYTLNNFVFVSSGAALEELYDTKYSVTLFKGNIYESAKQLMLTFPNRRQYMLNSLWLPLSFSTLFLLLVIGSFGLALYIILRQKQLSAMKMDFINNMTHELKTPISTISLASQMLKDEGIAAQSASRLKYAGMIYDENKRLANQVEKVLQMARMENGDIKYNKNPIDVHELLEIALNQFYIQVEDSGGELIQSLNAKESIIMADELHLTNVVNNLLDNALKYNDKEVPVIEVSTALDGDDILISVEDNGMGLKKDELNKIFDQFYRVNKGDVHDTKGFGIGLSYVKSIVQAHNGTITVQSQFSKGTTFTIRLPLKKA